MYLLLYRRDQKFPLLGSVIAFEEVETLIFTVQENS